MPNTPNRPDVAAIKARAAAATPGEWIAKGMGSHSYVLAPSHKWHKQSLGGRGYPIAVPRVYTERDGRKAVDFSSAGFAHDDAKFTAHARQDIPDLIALVEAQDERIEKLEAVVDMARNVFVVQRISPTSPLGKALAALDGGGDG